MRFWFGTCVILAPAIILPAAMDGRGGGGKKTQLTAEQKQNYKIAYQKEDYFTCNSSEKKSTGCKNAEILKKIQEKIGKVNKKKKK